MKQRINIMYKQYLDDMFIFHSLPLHFKMSMENVNNFL